MLLKFLIATSFLVIDPNGARTEWRDVRPTDAQVHPGATILELPSNYSQYPLDQFKDNGDGTALYEPMAPVAPVVDTSPNISGFINAVNSDPLVRGQALLFQLGSNLLPIFQNDMNSANIPALQQHWLDAKKVFGEDWLTPDVQKMIGGYALKYRIPLE